MRYKGRTMLRKTLKEQMLMLLESMQSLQHEGYEKKIDFYNECQQAAITIGETLESKMRDCTGIVSVLEQYCEQLYLLSQKETLEKRDIEGLDALLEQVGEKLKAVQDGYQIVFFPYKASMWDSMESIWKSFSANERCECVVVPIPYREFDAKTNSWIDRHELSDFPEYVNARDYREFQLETEQPDMAYIHNPYDDWNRVTCVYPQFFSRELKKHVKKLVYVPYYMTTGYISPEHLHLPVYEHMDYMIAQSDKFKDGCKGMSYYDKILPYGTPKADRVIKMCKEGVEVPQEWKAVLQGKKSVMLNTSIGCFLAHGDVYFQKLLHIFKWFKKREDIVLIWRPHPLLESTVRSMKPHLMEKYQELVAYFKNENIGIWDNTPDITRTIAIVDAYIGEDGSSVVNLFGVAGKPIFILENSLLESCKNDVARTAYLMDIENVSGKMYATSIYNGLYTVDQEFENVELVEKFEKQPRFSAPYGFFRAIQDTIFFAPSLANMPASYRVDKGEGKDLSAPIDGFYQMKQMAVYGDKIYYLPGGAKGLLIYNYRKRSWNEVTACIQHLQQNVQVVGETTAYSSVSGQYLWITAEYTNRVIRYNMKDDTYQIFAIGAPNYGYTGIVAEKEYVWLLESHTGKLVKLNIPNGKLQEYQPPSDFLSWSQETGRRFVYGEMFNMGDYLVAAPVFTNVMLKVNKRTGEMSRLIPKFWEKVTEACNGYHPKIHGAYWFAKKLNEKQIAIQRMCDGALAAVDIETEEYIVHHPHYTEETMHKLLDGQDGFEKLQTYYAFCRRESRLFSLEGFIDDLVNDRLEEVKVRQKEALSVAAANLDGTCGEKVYEFMMKVLAEE